MPFCQGFCCRCLCTKYCILRCFDGRHRGNSLAPYYEGVWKIPQLREPRSLPITSYCIYYHLQEMYATNMGVSKNNGTPKSSILIGKPSILGYPYFWKHPYATNMFYTYLTNISAQKNYPLWNFTPERHPADQILNLPQNSKSSHRNG